MGEVKERPILFSAPMVRALLAGTKTQTRRVVKPQPTPATRFNTNVPLQQGDWVWPYPSGTAVRVTNLPTGPEGWSKHCPYGQPGERLWVREAWWCDQRQPTVAAMDADGACVYAPNDPEAYGKPPRVQLDGIRSNKFWRKRPSIHMPRWACRITLEITDVRVQRLQECSVEDAIAEGITHSTLNDPRVEYQWLWDSINGAGAWELNPWVWAVSFKPLPTDGGAGAV